MTRFAALETIKLPKANIVTDSAQEKSVKVISYLLTNVRPINDLTDAEILAKLNL